MSGGERSLFRLSVRGAGRKGLGFLRPRRRRRRLIRLHIPGFRELRRSDRLRFSGRPDGRVDGMRPVPAVGTVVVVRPPISPPVGVRIEPAAVEEVIGEPVVGRPVPDGIVVMAAAELAGDIHPEGLVARAFQGHGLVGRADSRTDELDFQRLDSGRGNGAGRRVGGAGSDYDGENGQDETDEHAHLLHTGTLLLVLLALNEPI